jgi:hypothetical protein
LDGVSRDYPIILGETLDHDLKGCGPEAPGGQAFLAKVMILSFHLAVR